MPRKLSDRHLIRCFLQLDNLLVDKLRLLMDDEVRIKGALW